MSAIVKAEIASPKIVLSPAVLEAKRVELDEARDAVAAIAVVDNDSVAVAAGFLQTVKAESKAIAAMKKRALDPLKETEKEIRNWFRAVEDQLKELESTLKSAIGEYELAEKERQRKAFAAAAEAHKAGDHIEARAALVAANAHAGAKRPAGTSTREVWEAHIVDESAVPRDWCVPDEKRIAALARQTPAGENPPKIAGVEFTRKVIVASRAVSS